MAWTITAKDPTLKGDGLGASFGEFEGQHRVKTWVITPDSATHADFHSGMIVDFITGLQKIEKATKDTVNSKFGDDVFDFADFTSGEVRTLRFYGR